MKKFLIITELKRKRGKVSFYIAEITETGLRLIDNDFTVSANKHKGYPSEVTKLLIEKGEIEPQFLTENGYINYSVKPNFLYIFANGTDLTYVDTFNCK